MDNTIGFNAVQTINNIYDILKAAILLDVPKSEDQFFLLAHILRTPSPLENWSAPLVQTFLTTPTLELKKPIDNFVAMLNMLMQPIKQVLFL